MDRQSPPKPATEYWAWEYAAAGWFINFGFWQLPVPQLYSSAINLSDGERCNYAHFAIMLPDGSKHAFWSNSDPGPMAGCTLCSNGTCRTIHHGLIDYSGDAAMLQLQIEDPFTAGTATVSFPDGSKLKGLTVEDSNGNIVSSAGQGNNAGYFWTDTLGRQIPLNFQYNNDGSLKSGTVQYADSSGNQQTITLQIASVNFAPQFTNPAGLPNPTPFTTTMLSAIVLPDGSSYTFQYNNFGELTKITYPKGGYTRYDYAAFPGAYYLVPSPADYREVTAKHVCRRSDGGCTPGVDEDDTTYAPTINSAINSSTTVTTSIGSTTTGKAAYQFALFSSENGGVVPLETSRTVYNLDGSVAQTIATSYTPNYLVQGEIVTSPRPARETVNLSNGLVKKTEWDYDTMTDTFGHILQTDNILNRREYDWGNSSPGSLLRTVHNDWLHVNPVNGVDYTSTGIYVLNRALDTITYDGVGNTAAQTRYEYDNYGAGGPSTTGAVQQDPAFIGNGTLTRGNVTAVKRWRNTDGKFLVTSNQYDDTGSTTSTTDPLGNTTSFSYSDSWSNATCKPTQGVANAYRTNTTNALHQQSSSTYNSCTGTIASTTDLNGNKTTYTYDLMARPLVSNFPGGGETSYSYPGVNEADKSIAITSGLSQPSKSFFDGLGRTKQTQLVDPEGTDFVDTTYDDLGRVSTVSNPYRSTSDPTYGVTTTQYDGAGRVIKTIKQDGSAVTVQYDQTSTNSADGDCTLTTDEAGEQRKSCVDGLDRLIEVDEPQASTGSMTNPYVTLYSYDALGKLLSVNQKGDGSQAARQRNFTYDSLSRLLSATNPESGQISYSYDANGNVLQKTSPAPNQTGSATQTLSYCYDAVNRVTGRAYSAQSCPLSSPVVTYSYDSGTNGIGHLTGLTDQAGSGSYSYDALGRIASEQRTIANNSKTLSYTYNLDNSVATLTYPSGAVVTYTPDAAGRVLSATDVANNINYVTGATYAPDSSLTGFLSGQSTTFAGISNSFSYNPRLQPVTMAAVAPDCTGTGCSASVTISGSLGTAVSTTGTPPPSAAPGSALSGYEDSTGVNHWLYEASNDHLYEVYWNNNGNGRGYADATVETGGPLAAQTTALSTYLDNSQVPHWIYEDGAQHMQLFWIYSGTWGSVDNTVFVGSPAMATGSALTSKEDTNCMQHWAFFGSNNHLYEMHHDAVNGCLGAVVSGYSDGTAATGAPPAAPGSAMSMYFDNSQVAHWIYEDSNQHIQLLWWLNSGSWGNIDVTTTTGGPVAAPGSALTSREDTNCLQHWAYLGSNQHLYDAYHDDSSGCTGTPVSGYSDGTAATGAPAAAPGSALSMYFDNSQVAHWIYEDSSQHIQLLWYAGGSWGHLDVTATAGSPLAAPGSALASGEDTNCLQRWLYFGSNQHLYEVHAQGNAGGGCSGNDVWGYSDVTAATPSEVIDSGTVSLNVGNFTATACFGSSSNPACTGKPVNDSPSQVAAALATALNASGSPVTATASGATISMTWTATGSAATPVSPISTTHDNPALFPGPSFTSQAASFGGGTGANQPVFNITYNFNLGAGDNGNVIGITNNRDITRSQSFTYDYLNRLTSAQNSGTNCNQMTANGKTEYWGNSYGYDAWGNLLQKNVTKCSAENLSVSALSNNQLSGYGYDAAGNMTHDSTTNVNYTFDQENRITGAAGYTYTYDADGNRVEKSNGSTGTIYWYMSPGIVAESDLSGNLKSEYVFFAGDRVARKDFSGSTTSVSYYFSDHLKTASVITNSAGVISEDEDYYPWGGELQMVNSDSNHYKFTGKERDSETGLDYFGARYYGNWYGRFLSADWAAKPAAVPYSDLHDPQSLNLYGYVRNIPTSKADADGHCPTCPDPDDLVVGTAIVELQMVWNAVKGLESDVGNFFNEGVKQNYQIHQQLCSCNGGVYDVGNRSAEGSKASNNISKSQNAAAKSATKSSGHGLHRPYVRKATRQAVEAKAPRTADGKPIDPNTHEPIEGKPDLGHKTGNENWRETQQAEGEGLPQQQFNDRMNDPNKYQLEDPESNRSHKFEKPPP